MPANYYGDDEKQAAPAADQEAPNAGQEQGQQQDAKGDKGGESEQKTCVANKEAFPDAEPGRSYTVKIVRVHDDSVEFQAEPMEDEEQAPAEEAPEAEAPQPAGNPMY
jgi:hypothetical protein